jgi:hypothetical protein
MVKLRDWDAHISVWIRAETPPVDLAGEHVDTKDNKECKKARGER